MAITTTTLGAAVSTTAQNYIVLASTTGLHVGDALIVGDEAMSVLGVEGLVVHVMRGVGGTKTDTQASGANAYFGPATDFPQDIDIHYTDWEVTGNTDAVAGHGYISIKLGDTVRYIPVTDGVS